MRLVSIEEAAKTRWDAIVVGTSFAGMFFAHGLNARKKHRILFVERGQFASHADQVKDIARRPLESFSQTNTSGAPKEWTATKIFGGNSNCWSACIPRQHPNDFRHGALYGRGADWPLSYAELEKFYVKAEHLMDANGGGSDAILPRSAPFPFPAHKGSAADLRMRAADPNWFAQPTARSNGGRRNQCCANGICTLCPVNAKFTIENSLDLFDNDQSHYLLGFEARRVTIEAGRATGVLVRGADKSETELKGEIVALGANAISNAAILLRSGVDNPHLGRGIVEQLAQAVTYNIPFPNYFGGTHITGHGYHFYDGAFVKDRASVLIEARNDLGLARRERGKWLNNLRLKFIAADLPNPDNRVTLVDDEPHITWTGHSQWAKDGLKYAVDNSQKLLPFETEVVHVSEHFATEAHIQGMTPMAKTAGDGVVDPLCQVFGAKGAYAIGAGVFPNCPAANPTLTIAALGLRTGESLS